MTMTKEQIDALPGLVARFDCHGWDIRRGIMRQADDGAWVEYDDYATLAATVIEQQAEIDRLREAAKRLLDNYGFCSDGSDNYREVPVEDIEALIAALGDTQCPPTTTQTSAQVWICISGMSPPRASRSCASWHRARCP